VCDQVCDLQEPGLLHRRKVRYVGEVIDRTPLGAAIVKAPNPELCARVEAPFRKDDQPALSIVPVVKSPLEQVIKPFTDLFRGSFDRGLSPDVPGLLHGRRKQMTSLRWRSGDCTT
jgi:hypothetical protein